jgi:hypothetical protein
VHFTREPIIETIITPREGYKLLIKGSKSGSTEEYQVDAVEVISFGHCFFFRSMEKPRSFLLPITDYEIVEVKEVRMTLKHLVPERTIKIGGGKESRSASDIPAEPALMEPPAPTPAQIEAKAIEEENAPQTEIRSERRRERRRLNKRRRLEERIKEENREEEKEEAPGSPSESKPLFGSLLPPPPLLISETMSRYKEKSEVSEEPDLLPTPMEEKKKKKDDEVKKGPEEDQDHYLHHLSEEEEPFYSPSEEGRFLT